MFWMELQLQGLLQLTLKKLSFDNMINELDTIALKIDLPEHHLKTGDIGTVVLIYNSGAAFEVEFVAADGNTVALKTLKADMIRPAIGSKEILHLREIE